MEVANTLAYYATEIFTAVKKFYSKGPWTSVNVFPILNDL
jgi:hypothetical protein